ncbi:MULTISPECIES: PaaX family transcriptional regulator C-terminal domain-containing protein [unclassified Crossiella]|uniref:PaaX family transcriptional regulator n=1 Tax=unclassified Crossiella TaxID=2620835 RepID=UPI00200038AC|nr:MULTISPECIES: PaaX family transcriptional regulator C-terminal domain-containing protein [unclassified Crossiella]MCK2242017.1 PaaX family transcriptional regulator [Crossiella sp. S99.2]MCK2255920.1 PaaX family transcriptional regulator [Crossiella sp. S99.1]
MTTLVDLSEVDGGAADAQSAQPRQLIVTVYGLYAREVGGWLSVAALIRLLGELGVDEPAVRSSISRLKRRGILDASRVGGAAGYALSEQARLILREGDHRIFERPRATVADGWVLAVFSVPESERQKRHTLRSQLTRLGFGNTAPGVWIAPAHLRAETAEVLSRLDLSAYVDLFRADHLGFAELTDKVATWWDLAALRALYTEFLTAHRPLLARWRRRRTVQPAEAFADYVRLLTAWRRLPYLDPGLPAELLPADWPGAEAAELFTALQDKLAPAAHDHAESRITS